MKLHEHALFFIADKTFDCLSCIRAVHMGFTRSFPRCENEDPGHAGVADYGCHRRDTAPRTLHSCIREGGADDVHQVRHHLGNGTHGSALFSFSFSHGGVPAASARKRASLMAGRQNNHLGFHRRSRIGVRSSHAVLSFFPSDNYRASVSARAFIPLAQSGGSIFFVRICFSIYPPRVGFVSGWPYLVLTSGGVSVHPFRYHPWPFPLLPPTYAFQSSGQGINRV